jgi:predicted PurR-regulated permease PerM
MSKQKPQVISISARTIVVGLAIIIGLGVLWFIRDVLAIFFVALLLAALIDPFAHWFERRKIPRGLGVLIVYVILLAIMTGMILLIVPPLVGQLSDLARNLEGPLGSARGAIDNLQIFSERYGFSENIADSFAGLQQSLSGAVQGLFETIAGIFGGIATFILVLVLAFYMVVEEGAARKLFKNITPKRYRPYITGLIGRMQEKLGAWLRGQIILMVIIGVMTYIGLLIIGVEFSLVLAIFAGIAELVPYAGPIIAAVPAIIIAFSVSPLKALIVALLYFGIQQLENSVIAPKVMQKSVGLNPLISIFALLVGFKLAGFVGALLAIPVATLVTVFLRDIIGEEGR